MELLITEFHMHLQDIKSSPSVTGQNNNICVSSIRLNLLTKKTWMLKTPGGILVFRVLVQVGNKFARTNMILLSLSEISTGVVSLAQFEL